LPNLADDLSLPISRSQLRLSGPELSVFARSWNQQAMLVAIYLKVASERVSRSFLSQRVPIYVLRDTSAIYASAGTSNQELLPFDPGGSPSPRLFCGDCISGLSLVAYRLVSS
jgi:hypothetical protein